MKKTQKTNEHQLFTLTIRAHPFHHHEQSPQSAAALVGADELPADEQGGHSQQRQLLGGRGLWGVIRGCEERGGDGGSPPPAQLQTAERGHRQLLRDAGGGPGDFHQPGRPHGQDHARSGHRMCVATLQQCSSLFLFSAHM